MDEEAGEKREILFLPPPFFPFLSEGRFGVSRSPAVPNIVVDFFPSKTITPDAIRNGTERHGPLKRSSRIKDEQR